MELSLVNAAEEHMKVIRERMKKSVEPTSGVRKVENLPFRYCSEVTYLISIAGYLLQDFQREGHDTSYSLSHRAKMTELQDDCKA